MRPLTLFTLLLLSLSPVALASEAPSGVFVQTDLGRAEHGAGIRAGFGLGYRFASGWAVSASAQRLYQGYVAASFSSSPEQVEEHFPEARSRALFLSKEWVVSEHGNWTVRGSLGAHYWTLDAKFDQLPHFSYDFHESGTHPAAKIELLKRIATRLAVGVGLERYWVTGGDLDRVAVSLRYDLGRSE